MSDIDDIQLRRLDSGLLLVFESVMRSGKLTVTAAQLGLTQSAISHALGRLRDIFGDPLFLRRQQGVEPTPRAHLIAPAMARALAAMRQLLHEAHGFDPARAERVVQVLALDASIGLVAPKLLPMLAREAPGVRLAFRSAGRDESLKALRRGDADIAIGVYEPAPPGMIAQPLRTDSFAVVARQGHPGFAEGMSLEAWLRHDHLVVSAAGDLTGAVDVALAAQGMSRRVAASIPNFLSAMALASSTDASVTVPLSLAGQSARLFGLEVFDPPMPLGSFRVVLVRPRLPAPDPVVDWLCARFADGEAAVA